MLIFLQKKKKKYQVTPLKKKWDFKNKISKLISVIVSYKCSFFN